MGGHHHHTHPVASETNPERKAATQRVTLVGALVNAFLAIAQLVGGFFAQSQALIADGIHTLSDLASDFVVLIAAQHAHKDADDNHPYGHGRIETLATVILALMLAGVAVGIFLHAWGKLFSGEPLHAPHWLAILFAALAIVSKETLFHYTMRTAKRINSKMLVANAWHHRSDVISSVVVLVGIAGTQLGILWLDSVAAMIVAVMILYLAIRMILDSTNELVDTGVDNDTADAIRNFIRPLPGVEDVHMLRTRMMGGNILADAHIQVSSLISVSEGHQIAEHVNRELKAAFPDITDVTIHIDPEDDETAKPCADLPLRHELLDMLHADPRTAALWPALERTVLHYLDGQLQVEFHIKPTATKQALADFHDACKTVACIERTTFHQEIEPN